MTASLFKTKIAAAICAAAFLLFSGCERQIHEQSEFVLGTVCSINLYEDGSAELYGKLFARLRELNDIFNNYSDSSEISRVNQNAAAAPVKVSQDFYLVLKSALDFARLTGGAFDPTVGPLVKLWGFGKSPRVPSQEEIKAAQALVGWQCVVLKESAQTEDAPGQPEGFTGQNVANDKGSQDQNAGDEQETVTDQNPAAGPTVRFTKSGVRLDLGAIAKGYAADCLVDILRERGVTRASLSLGGNVYVYGKKPGGALWSVAIRDPSKPGQNAFMLKTRDATVVTSGAYERFFEQDGKTYGHILDPATGFPAKSGLESVTIVSHNSMVADALSTSLFVLGMEKIPEIKKSALAGGFECVLVDASGKAYASKGLKGRLSALNGQTIDWLPQ
ncbi:MAG: FAD:protein FMN transferase [Treponema sp.]|nr:FAD:protein FMN transferase [Treponema sp.]